MINALIILGGMPPFGNDFQEIMPENAGGIVESDESKEGNTNAGK